MIYQIIFFSIAVIGSAFAMESNNKQVVGISEWQQLKKKSANELYGSTFALTKRPIATQLGEWKWQYSSDHQHSECVKSHIDNVTSGNYIAALLSILDKTCKVTIKGIEVIDAVTIKDFIIAQPGIQEEFANKIVHEEIIVSGKLLKKASDNIASNKSLSDCIKETLQSVEQDENVKSLYFIDTRPIERFVLYHNATEIKEKAQKLIEEKKKNHDIYYNSSYNPGEKAKVLINCCQWCSSHYDKVTCKKSVPQVAHPLKKEKPKSFFTRLIVGFLSWFRMK